MRFKNTTDIKTALENEDTELAKALDVETLYVNIWSALNDVNYFFSHAVNNRRLEFKCFSKLIWIKENVLALSNSVKQNDFKYLNEVYKGNSHT